MKYATRRYFRIAPAYYIGIAGYYIVAALKNSILNTQSQGHLDYSLTNVIANITLVHGFVPSANNSVVPGGWSIGTEVAFYAIFPLLYRLMLEPRDWKRVAYPMVLASIFVAVCVHTVSRGILEDGVSNNSFIYFAITNQLPVFLIGMCYYKLSVEQGMQLTWWKSVIPCFFLVLTCLCLWNLKSFESRFVFIPVISAIAWAYLATTLRDLAWVNFKSIRAIGICSYSIYLTHFVFVWILNKTLSNWLFERLGGVISLAVLFLLVTALSLLAGKISTRCIERPFVNLGRRTLNYLYPS